MLGHNADFGHIHAVNMSQQTNLVAKRVGYLASTVCLHSGHELTTLLVNTMRRDLKSSNHLEVTMHTSLPSQYPKCALRTHSHLPFYIHRCVRHWWPSQSWSTWRRCPR